MYIMYHLPRDIYIHYVSAYYVPSFCVSANCLESFFFKPSYVILTKCVNIFFSTKTKEAPGHNNIETLKRTLL